MPPPPRRRKAYQSASFHAEQNVPLIAHAHDYEDVYEDEDVYERQHPPK